MRKAVLTVALLCLVGGCAARHAGQHAPTPKTTDSRAEQAKQAIIRFHLERMKPSREQIAEWQAMPLKQVSTNKYTYGRIEIDLDPDELWHQMTWTYPIDCVGGYQMMHGFLVIDSDGRWEAKPPNRCTWKSKESKDGQPADGWEWVTPHTAKWRKRESQDGQPPDGSGRGDAESERRKR